MVIDNNPTPLPDDDPRILSVIAQLAAQGIAIPALYITDTTGPMFEIHYGPDVTKDQVDTARALVLGTDWDAALPVPVSRAEFTALVALVNDLVAVAPSDTLTAAQAALTTATSNAAAGVL